MKKIIFIIALFILIFLNSIKQSNAEYERIITNRRIEKKNGKKIHKSTLIFRSKHPEKFDSPRIKQAKEQIKKIKEELKTNSDKNVIVDAYMKLGYWYRILGNHTNLRKYYTKVIEEFPKSKKVFNAQSNLVKMLAEMRRFNESIVEAKKLISNYPDSPKVPSVKYLMGYCYLELKNFKQALKVLNEIIKDSKYSGYKKLAQRLIDKINKQKNSKTTNDERKED